MKTEYMIVAAAVVAAYFIVRSSPAVAGQGGGVVVNGRTFRPDASGYYRSDEGGVTRWLA